MWRVMVFNISKHQLNNILEIIGKEYRLSGYQNRGDQVVFDVLKSSSKAKFFQENGIIPFKKILLKNHKDIKDDNSKIALIGINPCDNNALYIFYNQFRESELITPRKNLFVFVSECKQNEYCFCEYFGGNKINNYDLYLQNDKNEYSLFVGSEKGKAIVEKIPLKKSKKKKPKEIERPDNKFLPDLADAIEAQDKHIDFWTHIANNCFGCGSCSIVCPLCFCFRQNYENDLKGNSKPKICWDSCFNKEFSEIQNHMDFRAKNVDRLYNWYHHKFVRGFRELGKPLCTGCGRCIKACPANLNQKNILKALEEKEDEK